MCLVALFNVAVEHEFQVASFILTARAYFSNLLFMDGARLFVITNAVFGGVGSLCVEAHCSIFFARASSLFDYEYTASCSWAGSCSDSWTKLLKLCWFCIYEFEPLISKQFSVAILREHFCNAIYEAKHVAILLMKMYTYIHIYIYIYTYIYTYTYI